MMTEGHFAGMRNGAAADKTGPRYRMVRASKRTPLHELPFAKEAGDAVDFVTSSASCFPKGGKIVGIRLASIVLPLPGGPIIKILWPPAAAISRARLASV